MDIEEAALEEIVLDFHLNGSLNIPAEILRLALRLRRTAQPFMATTATLTLLITDEFSAKNAILNFLSITFITEADNVLAILFLRSHHKEQMDKVVDSVTFENVPHASTVFFWARVQGLICFVLLFTGLIIVDSQVLDCDNIYNWLIQYAAISAIALNCAQLFYVAFIMRCGRALLKQVFFALNEASRNIFVFCSAHLTTVGIAVTIEGYKYTLQPLVKVSFPAVFGVFFALESCRWWLWHRKCQNTDLPRTNQAGNV